MNKFIKLTEANDNLDKIIYINVAHIVSIGKSVSGRDTHVKIAGGEKMYFFVREKPEDILGMLEPVKFVAKELEGVY